MAVAALSASFAGAGEPPTTAGCGEPLLYRNPGLVVDLGVGLWAWPIPVDHDGDGDYDLLVSCPDVPYRGTYLFENRGPDPSDPGMPLFGPAQRVGERLPNVQVSYPNGDPMICTPGTLYTAFEPSGVPTGRTKLEITMPPAGKVRANQWKRVDFDGDGALDVVIGIGDWADYGWDDAYDEHGVWQNGPLHGLVYLARNTGSDAEPRFAKPTRVEAGGKPVDVYGMPSPNFADFDGDGDLDLICGEFLDRLTFFRNSGNRTEPKYDAGRFLTYRGTPIRMDLQMIVPTAVDFDRDGDVDLVSGDEDGRVAFIENTGGSEDGMPVFLPPRYFRQEADTLKFGALVTPVGHDWDGDGDDDLICGNTAGYIAWFENLGGDPPRWSAPRPFEADGETIRIQAGPNGSIQGPCEAEWGYTTLDVADWDGDGLADLIVNSIWGKVVWYQNVGRPNEPILTAARPVEVAWEGKPVAPSWNWWKPVGNELVTQWRTSPAVVDWDEDGDADLLLLDAEGYLCLWEREGGTLKPGRREFVGRGVSAFDSSHRPQGESDGPLRLNASQGGRSGRRKFCVVDWDGDGRRDLLVNSVNAHWLRNVGTNDAGQTILTDEGPLMEERLAGHTTSPTVVDFDQNGVPDLVLGAEDGRLYYLKNPRATAGE